MGERALILPVFLEVVLLDPVEDEFKRADDERIREVEFGGELVDALLDLVGEEGFLEFSTHI